jgi:hypothetical protein
MMVCAQTHTGETYGRELQGLIANSHRLCVADCGVGAGGKNYAVQPGIGSHRPLFFSHPKSVPCNGRRSAARRFGFFDLPGSFISSSP